MGALERFTGHLCEEHKSHSAPVPDITIGPTPIKAFFHTGEFFLHAQVSRSGGVVQFLQDIASAIDWYSQLPVLMVTTLGFPALVQYTILQRETIPLSPVWLDCRIFWDDFCAILVVPLLTPSTAQLDEYCHQQAERHEVRTWSSAQAIVQLDRVTSLNSAPPISSLEHCTRSHFLQSLHVSVIGHHHSHVVCLACAGWWTCTSPTPPATSQFGLLDYGSLAATTMLRGQFLSGSVFDMGIGGSGVQQRWRPTAPSVSHSNFFLVSSRTGCSMPQLSLLHPAPASVPLLCPGH